MATKQKRNNDDLYMDSYVNAVKDLIKMDDLSDEEKTDILRYFNEHDSNAGAKGKTENADDASTNDANNIGKSEASSAQKPAPIKAKPDKPKDKSDKPKDKSDNPEKKSAKPKGKPAKGKTSFPSKSKNSKASTPPARTTH